MSANPQRAAPARILVVDDEPDLCTLYELTLLREGHQVRTAGTLAQARQCLAEQDFDAVITDMRLPDGDGLGLLRYLAAGQRRERCIMITAYGSPENAVEALKSGAFDYLTKPVDLRQFRAVVQSALQAPEPVTAPAPLPAADTRPTAPPPEEDAGPGQAALARLVGESAAMRSVKRRVAKVARSMAPVLVHGESGTGKELVARAVHACSHRHAGPFVPVNCGAIPDNLLEAEFFGARKGSYTGAVQDREGFFQAAAGGTLFLDEIGDLPLAMQAKLLRAIQERSVRPLGATQEEPVDVRIVSATHKNLAAAVHGGSFRQDLFYRLNVIEIAIPPLRERREDIAALCQVLLARIAHESGVPAIELAPEQLAAIMRAPLAGNVRELENLLYRAVALGGARDSNLGDLAPLDEMPRGAVPSQPAPLPAAVPLTPAAPHRPASAPGQGLAAWLDGQERQLLMQALHESGLDLAAAAQRLGLGARPLRWRLQRLGIPWAEDDGAPAPAPR
ncbi:sigma-54 dependent transcriptional regulator [Ottowia sp.]|uniref:sigma-54-dependent transcriptional regulator n=1 Tax=Ottowia sp. TaxID=1898956 RepID=UPI0025F23AF5|nr:sigma-54 dependent transcriptional regulator [Ottowia sp.]